jgi:mannose-1-phosphate guanylyltransferase
VPRNTAPAIAYAAATVELLDPDAVMVVLPSDHILESGEAWRECLQSAVGLAEAGYLVTIGITPTRPETAYGYIKAGEELPEFSVGEPGRTVRPASSRSRMPSALPSSSPRAATRGTPASS